MQYCSLPTLDLTSITSPIHNCVLFSLLLRLFILSGVSSQLISSSILGTYWLWVCVSNAELLSIHLHVWLWWYGWAMLQVDDVVQSLVCVRLFVIPWTAAHQASLTFTISQSLLKLMSIEMVVPCNHLILCCPLLLLPSIFHSIRIFSNELSLHNRWKNIGVSASTSVLPVNNQDWFALGWTGLISLQSKGPTRVFFNTTV